MRLVDVSILSQPEGRLQPESNNHLTRTGRFQSSASRKAGCNPIAPTMSCTSSVFQSSASRKAGCNSRRAQAPGAGRSCFNPQPAGRPAATPARDHHVHGRLVSILSQPEGRLQPLSPIPAGLTGTSFNPQPAGRPAATRLRGFTGSSSRCFNPQPAGRPAATALEVAKVNIALFQSSASRKAGCNQPGRHRRTVIAGFNPQPAGRPAATRELSRLGVGEA